MVAKKSNNPKKKVKTSRDQARIALERQLNERERLMDNMPGDTISYDEFKRFNDSAKFVGEAVADPKLAPMSVSRQLYGFDDGPIKPMEGFDDPVFDLLMFGRNLYKSGLVNSIQDGVKGAFKMISRNPKYSIRQLMDRLPATVGGFLAGEELEGLLFDEDNDRQEE